MNRLLQVLLFAMILVSISYNASLFTGVQMVSRRHTALDVRELLRERVRIKKFKQINRKKNPPL